MSKIVIDVYPPYRVMQGNKTISIHDTYDDAELAASLLSPPVSVHEHETGVCICDNPFVAFNIHMTDKADEYDMRTPI